MKTITKILMLGLLLFPMFAFAQNATEQREYEVRVEWEDMQGYSERVPYKVPIYYDNDDNVIKHGPLKINYKHDLITHVYPKCIIAFTVSGNYVNGKLDGVFSLEKSATAVSVGVLKVKGTLNFVNGEPDGTWTFTETASAGGQTEYSKLVMVIKDKKLVSCDINDGEECFTISNNTFSGTHDGKVYKNGINTSEFIRKTGEKTKPDETVANLINGFVAGTISESDIIAKGFGFERSLPWIDFDYKNISYYISKLKARHFMTEDQYLTFSWAVNEIVNREDINPALTLKRGNVKSAEEMIAIANTIKTSEYVREGPDMIGWYEKNDGGGERYNYYYYGKNYIVLSDNLYYFTDEAKLKFEEAIKTALEEKRLEQERIAEEKRLEQERIAEERRLQQERAAELRRLQEIERQRKEIQPICDYLVLGKSALSICYDEQAGNYFDPTGLSSTWALDLEKAIKPFCKIVACKLVSYENQGDTNIAVLDITKFNKKGNITYRVPVTIVNGKILVTSINFSNATVVE